MDEPILIDKVSLEAENELLLQDTEIGQPPSFCKRFAKHYELIVHFAGDDGQLNAELKFL